jgi:hypothetical protein
MWAAKEVDRFRRSFLWHGDDPDKVRGGHCLVKWDACTGPNKWGALGSKISRNLGVHSGSVGSNLTGMLRIDLGKNY